MSHLSTTVAGMGAAALGHLYASPGCTTCGGR
jgi:hypothetical protein